MRNFKEIYAIAAERKGGEKALETLLRPPKTISQLAALPDDRWLSCMTRCVFQAGFNWKVVQSMWPGFEEAFEGFDPGYCALLHDDDFDRLVSDKRIVRNGPKIRCVQHNGEFVNALALEHASAGKFFAQWPARDFVGLLAYLKKRGSRLGGNTGQYFLRFMGVDGFILSRDVVARLVAEGVVDKKPSSQKTMGAVQEAFNAWHSESGRSVSEISQILAFSVE